MSIAPLTLINVLRNKIKANSTYSDITFSLRQQNLLNCTRKSYIMYRVFFLFILQNLKARAEIVTKTAVVLSIESYNRNFEKLYFRKQNIYTINKSALLSEN